VLRVDALSFHIFVLIKAFDASSRRMVLDRGDRIMSEDEIYQVSEENDLLNDPLHARKELPGVSSRLQLNSPLSSARTRIKSSFMPNTSPGI
jgi:hypothetical protein